MKRSKSYMKIFITVDQLQALKWISILSAAWFFVFFYGQNWTMAAQCVIKNKRRPEILVMTTMDTLWTIHKKQQGITIIKEKKRTFCVDSKNSKSATTTFLTDFILWLESVNLLKKWNKWLFDGHSYEFGLSATINTKYDCTL